MFAYILRFFFRKYFADEGSPATATYTSQIDMERFRRLLAAEEENLKNACATPKQDDIFARIHVDSGKYNLLVCHCVLRPWKENFWS